jgi:hypothetical protein
MDEEMYRHVYEEIKRQTTYQVRCAVQGSYSLRVSKLPLKKNRPPPAQAGAAKRAHHAMHAPVCHTPVVWFD